MYPFIHTCCTLTHTYIHTTQPQVPDDIDQYLTRLLELNLDENELETLPKSMSALTTLTLLSFNRNFFYNFPASGVYTHTHVQFVLLLLPGAS